MSIYLSLSLTTSRLPLHSADNNKASISRAGGIEAVINALRRHVDHAVVQEAACAALYNLSFNSESGLGAVALASCLMLSFSFHRCTAGQTFWLPLLL
jgi:hypothetical protein